MRLLRTAQDRQSISSNGLRRNSSPAQFSSNLAVLLTTACALFCALAAVLSCMFLTFCVLRSHRSWYPFARRDPKFIDETIPGKITVWHPRGLAPCVASSLATGPAQHSESQFPYAVLRDAAFDYRHASRRDFSSRNSHMPVFARVVLFVTAHLSVVLRNPHDFRNSTRNPPHVYVKAPLHAHYDTCRDVNPWSNPSPNIAADILGRIDHVIQVNPFVRRRKEYSPNQTTIYGQEVTEWQVIVSFVPAECSFITTDEQFRARFQNLDAAGATLNIHIPLERFDGEVLPFDLSMAWGCIVGWENPGSFPGLHQFRRRVSCRHGARGAVALAGSALHGDNRLDAAHVRQVAHFAVRALLGRIRFDVVSTLFANCRALFTCCLRRPYSMTKRSCVGDLLSFPSDIFVTLFTKYCSDN